jgi:hypothetical protein
LPRSHCSLTGEAALKEKGGLRFANLHHGYAPAARLCVGEEPIPEREKMAALFRGRQ